MDETNSLAGRVVLVTGAGGHGVGSGVCDALVKKGATLVVNDVDIQAAEAAAVRYPNSVAVHGDIGDAADVDRMVTTIVDRFGHLDSLVNNAGIGLARPAHLATEADFDRLYAIDVRGLWLMSRAFARHRIEQGGGGSLVNISSVHANHTQNGYALYAGAKGAVEGLTRGFATELGPYDIRCNGVAPGAVLDESVADRYGLPTEDPVAWIREHSRVRQVVGRAVTPVDVGQVVAFLLSEAAWAVAGQIITVDAGLSLLLYDRVYTGDALA